MSVAARALGLLVPPFCWACGRDAGPAEPLCGGCRRELRWLGVDPVELAGVVTWAPLAYEGPARALVRALKFRGATGLAEPMAAQMVAGAPTWMLRAGALLVPVPLHRARLRRRGFNQAERLAAAISRRTGLAVSQCLRRGGRGTARQVGRGRVERMTAIAGAVATAPRARVPERAVLVDDVVTTGATLAACAAVLREAGAREVLAVAYARTPAR